VRQPLVEGKHLVRRVPARKAEELGEIPELRQGGPTARAGTDDLGLAACGAHQTHRDLDERRLAGAVRAEQPHELSLLHREVDPF